MQEKSKAAATAAAESAAAVEPAVTQSTTDVSSEPGAVSKTEQQAGEQAGDQEKSKPDTSSTTEISTESEIHKSTDTLSAAGDSKPSGSAAQSEELKMEVDSADDVTTTTVETAATEVKVTT